MGFTKILGMLWINGNLINGFSSLDYGYPGDLLDPTKIYYSEEVDTTYTGLIYQCIESEVVVQPQVYPQKTCSNFVATVKFYDPNNTLIGDFEFEVINEFDLANDETDHRNITITKVQIPNHLANMTDVTFYANRDPCFLSDTKYL